MAQQTERLIRELLPPGLLNVASVMILVNALYLEADWARPFGKYPTEDQPFTRLDGSTVTVPLMHERLSRRSVRRVRRGGASGPVELRLPRFESDSNINLREAIESGLGAGDVFGVAGFEGIAPGITLESAVHAADFAVDEIGTVAAVATALGFEKADRPSPTSSSGPTSPSSTSSVTYRPGRSLFVGRVLDRAA